MASPPALPNSETPLAFLPPTLASQLELSRYILAATCGMFIWDMLINLRNDYRLLTMYRIAFPAVVYFLSRITSLAYIISATVFRIGPVANCQALDQIGGGVCFVLASSLTALLFFFRVRAIFHKNKWIVAFFLFLWLGTVAGSVTVPFSVSASHIGPTDRCINTGVKTFGSTGIIVLAVNDTLVFFAISWKLLSSSAVDKSFKAKFKTFISGDGLPVITKSLLQSGQEYYLITVVGNIVTMAMLLAPASLPAVFHGIFTVPNLAIGNAMACHVYRDIKFGRISSANSTNSTIPVHSVISTIPPFSSTRNINRRISHDPYGMEIELESNRDAVEGSKYGVRTSGIVYQSHDPPSSITDYRNASNNSLSDQHAATFHAC